MAKQYVIKDENGFYYNVHERWDDIDPVCTDLEGARKYSKKEMKRVRKEFIDYFQSHSIHVHKLNFTLGRVVAITDF